MKTGNVSVFSMYAWFIHPRIENLKRYVKSKCTKFTIKNLRLGLHYNKAIGKIIEITANCTWTFVETIHLMTF